MTNLAAYVKARDHHNKTKDARWTRVTENKSTWAKLSVPIVLYIKGGVPVIKLAKHRDFFSKDVDDVVCWRYLDMGDFPPMLMIHEE
jgi:hypothetical protein